LLEERQLKNLGFMQKLDCRINRITRINKNASQKKNGQLR